MRVHFPRETFLASVHSLASVDNHELQYIGREYKIYCQTDLISSSEKRR